MTTPRQDGYFMPGEWHPHTACWMAWPCKADTFSKAPLELEAAHTAAKKCWSEVAKAISLMFELLRLIADYLRGRAGSPRGD